MQEITRLNDVEIKAENYTLSIGDEYAYIQEEVLEYDEHGNNTWVVDHDFLSLFFLTIQANPDRKNIMSVFFNNLMKTQQYESFAEHCARELEDPNVVEMGVREFIPAEGSYSNDDPTTNTIRRDPALRKYKWNFSEDREMRDECNGLIYAEHRKIIKESGIGDQWIDMFRKRESFNDLSRILMDWSLPSNMEQIQETFWDSDRYVVKEFISDHIWKK